MLNRNKDSLMPNTVLLDMKRITRYAAEPRPAGDSVKAAIGRAARTLGLTYRRAYSFWHAAEGTAVRAEEADKVRQAELRLMARERIQLGVRLEWIEARFNAREAGEHGAREAMADPQGGTGVHLAGEAPAAGGGVAGGEGVIPDPRQMALGRGW